MVPRWKVRGSLWLFSQRDFKVIKPIVGETFQSKLIMVLDEKSRWRIHSGTINVCTKPLPIHLVNVEIFQSGLKWRTGHHLKPNEFSLKLLDNNCKWGWSFRPWQSGSTQYNNYCGCNCMSVCRIPKFSSDPFLTGISQVGISEKN